MTGKDVLPEKDLLQKVATKKKVWIFVIRKTIKSRDCHCKNEKTRIRQNFISKEDNKKVNEPLIKNKKH